jgi:hypothetical protein
MKGQVWHAGNENYHKKIEQPVLLVEGTDDQFIPLSDSLDMIKVDFNSIYSLFVLEIEFFFFFV